MAGPQVQRPTSAYYTGLNGSSNGGHANGGGGAGGGLVTSTSHHTGLHTIRTISHDSELIYRGSATNATTNGAHLTQHASNNNGTGAGGGGGGAGSGVVVGLMGTAATSHTSLHNQETCTASTSRSVIQQQPGPTSSIGSISGGGIAIADSSTINIASIAGTGQNPSDALIVPVTTALTQSSLSLQQQQQQQQQQHSFQASNRDKQRSIEIIVDASKCDELKSEDDVEQGKSRRSSRHRHRPLHRRLMTYLKSFFHRNTTQTDSELEEFETPARYRPDSLSALSRATRFTEDEIKRIYRGFKAECPTGVVKEDTFKLIYAQFFPQGANPTKIVHVRKTSKQLVACLAGKTGRMATIRLQKYRAKRFRGFSFITYSLRT
ncbi:uncharacterized protein [Musca autumnalis]|uniref:uncharacterized protein n=1 Tax=Musca autumnalis TaxID=221902 RepID=UPI003CED8A1F